MRTTFKPLVIAAAIGLTTFSSAAIAQDAKIFLAAIVQQDNAEQRIALSGKLRMLSQRISSAACHFAAGIDREGSAKLLNASIIDFEKIIGGLEFGDSDLGIQAAESRRMTIAKIHQTREIWTPYKTAATAVAEGENSDANLQILLEQNMTVLGSAQSLVEELVGQYSNSPTSTHANLLLIDIAGRQRMLTQKMSKEACVLASNANDADTAKSLQGTMQIFEMSLEALRHGMPELGIKAPPSPVIATGLVDVENDWKVAKPMLETVLSGRSLDADTAAHKFQALNKTMATMHQVVGLYVKYTKPST